MRIIGLCSFYDESPKMLAAMLSSGSKLPVDHWVVLDGAYSVYPDGQASSQIEQHEIIARTCNALGVGWTIHVPATTWMGNEVEKRDRLFAYGQLAAKAGDWFVIMDADQTFKSVPFDLRPRLEASEYDAARVTFAEYMPPKTEQQKRFHWEPISYFPLPIFFRVQDDPIRVVRNHYTYETSDGRRLWGHGLDSISGKTEDYLDLTDLHVSHRKHDRTVHRQKGKDGYYERRERLKIETSACIRCDREGTRRSVTEIEPIGPEDDLSFSAWPVACCEEHFEEIEAEKLAAMEKWNIPAGYFEQAPVGAVA
jgi:hypothetical protein